MKKVQRSATVGLCLAATISGLSGCNDPGYKVTGNNKKELDQYSANREGAIAYLLKTTAYVGEIRAMKSLPGGGPALPAQHKKMLALRAEGDALGDMFSPLSYCRGAGYKAQEYWSVVAGNIRTETPEDALAAYVEEAKNCQDQIDNGPKPKTYIETDIDKKPPVDGCLKIISLGSEEKVQGWSCSTELLSKR
ncbi:hypothetical protein [Pseudomonas chlororaphis]|uniref:hypothetical protein n=1 Tax=Pseudomonas chlororaphis TaxID=587753 RepID=UPI0011CDF541|nr:hypothetical protein [Pseudomonas chlororaphis]